MERERLYQRTIQEVRRDFSRGDIGEELTFGNDRRHRGLKEVMLSIPEEDYLKLKGQLCKYALFIPSKDNLGEVFQFESTTTMEEGDEIHRVALVVYLDPRLEEMEEDDDIAIAVTAHELAHIARDHKILSPSDPAYGIQEDEAWNLVCEWGFEQEVKKHHAYKDELEKIRKEVS